jgi:UDP-2,3-diacylglucosamine pyrophosphatase LpxH
VRFLRQQANTPEGKRGAIELFFNGDFLEFAQADQAAFTLVSNDFWCSEDESLRKANSILAGHPTIFAALRLFQANGNAVTIAAGNHDVDLYWPKVQARVREAAGAEIGFGLHEEWFARYGGKLQIAHGHMDDPANKFASWQDPVRNADLGQLRLEMCPGTLFMVRFVNKLEGKYPFADNLLPVTKLASVLLKEDKLSLLAVGWLLARFAASSPAALGAKALDDYGTRLRVRFQDAPEACDHLAATLEKSGLAKTYPRAALPGLTEKQLADIMLKLLGRMDDAEWEALFAVPRAPTVGFGDDVTLAAIVKANFEDTKQALRSVAQGRVDNGAEVVVMGHTHQPDSVHFKDGGHYYNPGCWTRYLELKPGQNITMVDLEDESRYPYQLNYVRIEQAASGELVHGMFCFEKG